MIDSRDVNDLHPCLGRGFAELKRRMKAAGFDMQTNSTYRDNERQAVLYAQGRTTPGKVVTNAKPGDSIHNYRLAFDVFKNVKGGEFSDGKFFNTAGKLWEEMGGTWGGHFKSIVDKPHMEYTGGLSLSQLKAGKTLPQGAKMKWEEGIKPGSLVTINPGARYGYSTDKLFNNMPIPPSVYTGKQYLVSSIKNNNGRDEALISELWRYVGVADLALA